MLRLIAAFCLLVSLPLRGEETVGQQVVRENRTRRIVAALGEVEAFKSHAIELVQLIQKENNIPVSITSRIASAIDSEAFETAVIQHYSAQFTLEELGHLDELFKAPAMRGVLYWVRTLPEAESEKKDALEKIRKTYPPATVEAFVDLLNSALGRQLVDAARTAAKIRHQGAVAAIQAAIEKVRPPN